MGADSARLRLVRVCHPWSVSGRVPAMAADGLRSARTEQVLVSAMCAWRGPWRRRERDQRPAHLPLAAAPAHGRGDGRPVRRVRLRNAQPHEISAPRARSKGRRASCMGGVRGLRSGGCDVVGDGLRPASAEQVPVLLRLSCPSGTQGAGVRRSPRTPKVELAFNVSLADSISCRTGLSRCWTGCGVGRPARSGHVPGSPSGFGVRRVSGRPGPR